MQTIAKSLPNINSIFNEFDSLYAELSEKNPPKKLVRPVYSEAFRPLVELFQENGYAGGDNLVYQHAELVRSKVSHKDGIIVCFSGGKDSTATAKHFLKQGKDITLYHLKGINQTYKDEWQNAQQLAEYLGVPIIIEEVKLSGQHEWVEHPMKNMILANQALQYALRNDRAPHIAFGNFSTSTLDSDPFDVCGGDCKEMWDIYENIISTVYPDFQLEIPLYNFQDTIDILTDNPELVEKTQSCIGPYRYRNKLNRMNRVKYNIDLKQNRCGSCWKCCLEYCVFCDRDIYEYNEAYYKHCLEVLRNTVYKETGVKISIDDVWSHYFFYDKERSKYYGKCWK